MRFLMFNTIHCDWQALLRKTEAEVQQMIQERLKKVDDIKHTTELNKVSLSVYVCLTWSASAELTCTDVSLSFRQCSDPCELRYSLQLFAAEA